MNIDTSIKYLDYIANHYSEIRNNIEKESIKKFGCEIDEDIFHDTILKCLKTNNKLDLTKDKLINYIFISYKTNYLRELEYARNKNKDDIEVSNLDNINNDRYYIDYNNIKNIIINKFGKKEWSLFEDYIYGESIQDISKENSEKGLYYRFNKIKTYVKQYI